MNHSLKIRVNLGSGLVKRPSKEEIIVPLGAILAAKWSQQQKRKQDHFEQPATMRAPDVHAAAGGATSKEIETTVWHVVKFRTTNANLPLSQNQILTLRSQFSKENRTKAGFFSLVTLAPD
jgi:hypothetical protein